MRNQREYEKRRIACGAVIRHSNSRFDLIMPIRQSDSSARVRGNKKVQKKKKKKENGMQNK